ncbi:glycoside hydrolase family 38 C-terminal domain-containing protein [Deinococcus sp. YIM 134068]|uniref:alpha-mannosidase n=1 Tax=Deinococcus lichenicola TaxID=3118910 RepID=UPI002F955E26
MISVEQDLTRLAGRLDELSAWRNISEETLPAGSFTDADGATSPVAEGQPWPSVRFPVRMRFEVPVPEGGPVILDLQPGGEALVRVDGTAVYALNPYHREVTLPAGAARTLTLDLEVTPRGLHGSYIAAPMTGRLRLVQPDAEVRELLADLGAAHDAAVHLLKRGRETLAARLADLLHETVKRVRLPRDETEGYLARVVQASGHGAQLGTIWEGWTFTGPPATLGPEHRESLGEARHFLAAGLAKLRSDFPPEGALSLTGHAHIDLAWLWPLHETRRKALRSFSTVLDLMDRFPSFHFSQSTAQLYAWVQEDDPALFERIRERVTEGRWEIVGGTWVEPDGQLLSGESWARQLLHGQRYFERTFGRRATVAWLPDTFGFAGNLPQVLADGGLPFFFTTKLNWNETNRFPHDLYRWEGLDGTRVLAHSFLNPSPGEGYNGSVVAHDLLSTWANFRGARRHGESLFTFGWGDGGGGPTPEMLERYERVRDFPGLPRLNQRPSGEFFADLRNADPTLPVWTGEHYLELHRGIFTTQAAIKQLHRRLEHTLVEAEAAATLAHRHLNRAYPQTELTGCWTVLLRNQFHDILPGSSIREVNVTAEAELSAALERAEEVCRAALDALSAALERPEGTEHVVIWNLTAADRPLLAVVHLPEAGAYRAFNADGEELSCSGKGETLYLHDPFLMRGLSHEVITLRRREEAAQPSTDGLILENAHLRAEVGPDGSLVSLIHKASGREAVRGRANILWQHVDVPRAWDAWEIDASASDEGEELTVTEPPRAERQGEVGRVHVRREGPGVVAEQTYELWPNDRALRVHTTLRVTARRTLLRAAFPLAVRAPWSSAETTFGTVTRPTHRNTSWQTAAFEVAAHRFLDLSEGSFGVSLLNDGKYGHGAGVDELSLTLLRTPIYPDPYADQGKHSFTYALYPHAGDWRQGTRREAHSLNAPLRTVRPSSDSETPARLPARHTYLRLPEGVWLSALKHAEEGSGYVLRVYEANGDQTHLTVESADFRVSGELNLLEDALPGDPLAPLAPYRVRTLALAASSSGEG